MANKTIPPTKPPGPPAGPPPNPIEPITLRDALEERFLTYALSTIMHRALPDVRDGLKPVHRRLLYAMRELKLNPTEAYKKCARVVGDVIGKYHPHGDQAVYDAMVRLAQDFAVRYPLVDGQGNFGNIDGDNAAAYRYTEARLTTIAEALLEGLDENTVDFRPTFNGDDNEPVVLPANFPHLLANGSTGIAVGMATSIPPHNVDELCTAILHLIKHPNATIDKLVEFIPSPDFPTGGIIVEPRASILEAYKTGRGGFRLRARWHKEETGRGTYLIVVTEIPYGVQKAKLVEKLAELLTLKKLPLLEDVRDESAEDIRLVLEPKTRTVDALVLMESLFRTSELEVRFPLNMNVLSRGQVPNVLNLREVLQEWLDHRKVVLTRRTNFRLDQIARRLEILAGYLIAYLNLDEVIRIVRFEDDPKAELMSRFALSELQTEAILSMRLRALNKLQEIEIRREHDDLTKEQGTLQALLASDEMQWDRIASEVKATRDKFGKSHPVGKRRSELADAPEIDVDIAEAMIEREPVTIVVSEKGWIRALKGHVDDLASVQFKQDDSLKRAVKAQTTDKLVIFTSNGKFFTLGCDKLPGGRGHGEPLKLMVDLEENHELVEVFVHQPGRRLLVASTVGNGFVVPEDEVVAMTRKGKQVLNLTEPEEAVVCVPVDGDQVAVMGENRKMLVFGLEEVNEMTRGKGVRLQKYKDAGLADVRVFARDAGLTWLDGAGRTFTLNYGDLSEWIGVRAQAGQMAPKGFPRSNKFGPAF
jgi:topoisomerase IV subunit A